MNQRRISIGCRVGFSNLRLLIAAATFCFAQTPAHHSGFALMGGGTDQDAAFKWMCDKAAGGDFVVLRASGAHDYDPYIRSLCPALKGVDTLIITSRQEALQPVVAAKISAAGALFISGGSQDNYINWWQNTPVEDSINAVIERGYPFGGTSAGLAVMGEYVFSARNDTIHSQQALKNPFDPRVTIDRNFLHVPHLEGKITDSHFVARNRMGRLVAFLARIAQDGWTIAPYGIGIDEKTAVLMEADGTARVVGAGAAYFISTPGPPEVCRANTPLTYNGLSVYRLSTGSGRFDVASWKGTGGTTYTISAVEGVLKSTLPNADLY